MNAADYIKSFDNHNHMGSLFEHTFISLTEQECVSEYIVSPKHFNPNGILHGGALFTLMDTSQGAFVHFTLDRSRYKYAATGTATIKYAAPVISGKVRIVTKYKEIQNRKLFVLSEAFDESGRTVATMEEIWIAALLAP